MTSLYRRYRKWAASITRKHMVITTTISFIIGFIILPSIINNNITRIYFPWILFFITPIAALDAYGAAEYQGKKREGIIRAVCILFFFWTLASLFLFHFIPNF